jgi:tetratricopeptide (TPR) repeat protein
MVRGLQPRGRPGAAVGPDLFGMLAQSRIPRVLMLSVFRDGTLHGQAELTAQGLRIGRGSENDIVLEDAAKRVSRLHAELRLEEDGAITLTDLRSANGTWIAGERIDTEALEPGVPFTIGPYRLMLEEFADAGAAADYPSDSVPVDPSVAPSLAQPAESMAQAPAAPGVRRRGDTAKTQGPWKVAAGLVDVALNKHRWATLIGGGAVVGIAGLGIWSMSGDASSPPHVPTEVATPPPVGEVTPPPPDPHAANLDAADKLLVQGDKTSAETALRDHITPVLQADPTNARALEQKGVAERIINPAPPVTTTATPGVAPPPRLDVRPIDPKAAQHVQRLNEARAALERNDFKTALSTLQGVLEDAPDNAEARALQQKALLDRGETAKRILAEAEGLVKDGRLPEAIDAFRRADAIDPSVNVSGRVAEVRQKMVQEGELAFLDGMNYAQAMRGDQAIPLLQKAWRYLPDGHRDKATVRAELVRLGAAVR